MITRITSPVLDTSCRVTTAAVIWVLAAIGAAIGLGRYGGAFALAVVTVTVLVGVELLESSVKRLTRGVHGGEED